MNIKKLNIAIVFLLVTVSALAQGVKVEAKLDTNSILIGDQTHLVLKVSQGKNQNVQWPVISDTITKNIEVIDISEPDSISTKDGNIEISRKYLITSFDSGYFAIPPFRFIYDYINDSTFSESETQALLLTVKTIEVDTTKAFRDIKDIESEPYTLGEILTYFVAPPLAVILLALLIIYIIRRRKANKPLFRAPRKPLPPPHIEAITALDKLKEKRLWQNNATKEYYSVLTDIMRRYIERRYDFPAQEMVTTEIMGSLLTEELGASLMESTNLHLSNADLVKFAKFEPLGDENDAALKWAYEFVNQTADRTEEKEAES